MPPLDLLYLHGFRSSPQSTKARRVAAWVAEHRPSLRWSCPQLPPSPAAAIRLIDGIVEHWLRDARAEGDAQDRIAVIGSSLGGYYATVLAERIGCRAVLLNPAVDPARDLAAHLGEQKAWHSDEHFVFTAEHVEQLLAMRPAAVTRPQRYLAVIATGDEVLDWREMHARYTGCAIRLVEGSDHALSDFDDHLPAVMRFLDLTS